MSVKYSISPLLPPSTEVKKVKYYAKAQVREVIKLERIASELAFASSLTRGDIYNVLYNLPQIIAEHLADGDLIDLGGLGKLQFQISSKGADSLSEFTTQNIKQAKLQFRPGKTLSNLTKNLQFEKVISLKEKREIKRKSKKLF